METIKEAKEYLRKNFDKGVICPCCGQFVKLYKRKLNAGMARNIIRIYHETDTIEFIHVEDTLRKHQDHSGHDWPLLRFWELIEEDKKAIPKGGSKVAGMWRMTQKGVDFVERKISLPKRVNLFNNRFYDFSKDTADIVEALGDHFDYDELMRNE